MRIQEIAREAGVSASTVSRVFGNHPNIREEVRERVFAVARRHNYRPRLSSKQQNVVIVSPYKAVYPIRSYVEMVISELAQALSARGYRIEMLPQDNLEQLERIRFCAAVAIGTAPGIFRDWDERFGSPLVIVDREISSETGEIYSVRSDEAQAMELGVGCLAAHGCRNVGVIIYGRPGTGNTDSRRENALAALKRHGLPASERRVRFALAEEFVETTGKLLDLGIDGLFAPGGNAGILAAYALALYHRHVPGDISLVTSERTMYSRYAIPPQTTISQDYEAEAAAVADAIDSRLRGAAFPRHTVIPYKLIERDSVKSE